jgi:hypothetical protein
MEFPQKVDSSVVGLLLRCCLPKGGGLRSIAKFISGLVDRSVIHTFHGHRILVRARLVISERNHVFASGDFTRI